MMPPHHKAMFDLLDRIAARPEMYLGGAPGDGRAQLRNLEWLLYGYQLALGDHLPTDQGNFVRDFARFVHDRYRCGTAIGAIRALDDLAKDDDAAWTLVWEAIRAFRDSVAARSDR